MKESDIFKIVESAQKRNKPLGITGLLLYIDGGFIQLLEGEEDRVKKLYEKISKDNRHEQLKVILQGTIPERDFPSWNMGLKVFTKQDLDDLKQINNNPEFNLLQNLRSKNDLAIELMRYFYKNGKIDFNEFWNSSNTIDIEDI